MSFLGVGGVGADLKVPTEFLVKKADMKINKTTSSCALIVWDVNFGHKILCTLNVEKKNTKKCSIVHHVIPQIVIFSLTIVNIQDKLRFELFTVPSLNSRALSSFLW